MHWLAGIAAAECQDVRFFKPAWLQHGAQRIERASSCSTQRVFRCGFQDLAAGIIETLTSTGKARDPPLHLELRTAPQPLRRLQASAAFDARSLAFAVGCLTASFVTRADKLGLDQGVTASGELPHVQWTEHSGSVPFRETPWKRDGT